MTVRNLEYLLAPRSVALIGAGSEIGGVVTRNLFQAAFEGPVMLVDPGRRVVAGVPAYPDVASLPLVPDLAVITLPAPRVPELIGQLAVRGTRAAVVIPTGFGSDDGGSHSLRQALLDTARPHLMRILGPHSLGLIAPREGLNASLSHLTPPPGRIAFVAQSGSIITAVLDWAHGRGIGFSRLLALGDMADVDFGDLLDYLASEPDTHAILLHMESVTATRKFMSAARAAARMKPVIVVKSGRYAEGGDTTASLLGALAGTDAVYEAAFRRSGMLRVDTLGELFAAVETLALAQVPPGGHLAILTNSAGMGLFASDALIERGGRLAEFSAPTQERLRAALPPGWPGGNPVNLLGDAPGERYAAAFEALIAADEVDAVLALNCPNALADPGQAAQALINALAKLPCRTRKPLLIAWVGGHLATPARQQFAAAGLPSYATPEAAVRAFMHMVDYRHNQRALLETPPSIAEAFTPDSEHAHGIVTAALDAGREWLNEAEAKDVLAAYGIAVVATRIAADPEQAAAMATELEAPFALKIISPDILHKSAVGGLTLNLEDAAAVREAACAMRTRVRQRCPGARLQGFTVQPMIHRPQAWELIAGVIEDPQFGPVMVFGQGGSAAALIRDRALDLPPLNLKLAEAMLARTRIDRQFYGFPGRPGADREAIALTLVRLSQLVADIGAVSELEINPLLADRHGVIALAASLRLVAREGSGTSRFAIRPYPRELEESLTLDEGRELMLRPVRPEDEPELRAAFLRLTPDEVRLRFFRPMKQLSHFRTARFSQMDYDREMALVLTDPGPPGQAAIHGVVHIHADPANTRAEYAIIVHHSLTGRGLGRLLMERIIDYCRSRGIGEIYGDVLRENNAMLKLNNRLGFQRQRHPEGEPGVVRVSLAL